MPKAGEIRVKTLAAGVSALDLSVRAFRFPGFPKLPFTPGVDVVGVVDAVGPDVRRVSFGETVAALLGFHGGYAQSICMPQSDAVQVPAGVDPAQAVCLVANYVTAYSMLHRAAAAKPGELALVHGAAGGVGTALLELGTQAGLTMYGTASPQNHALVRSLGATPIDYHKEDFVERIASLTGDGVDMVFDPIGGASQLLRSYRALRAGGRLVWFGVAATKRRGRRVIVESLATRLVLSWLHDGKQAKLPPDSKQPLAWYQDTLSKLLGDLAAGKLRPRIAARFPLRDAASAHALLERGSYAGKVVLIP